MSLKEELTTALNRAAAQSDASVVLAVHGDQDLVELFVGFQIPVSLHGILQQKGSRDLRMKAAVIEAVEYILFRRVSGGLRALGAKYLVNGMVGKVGSSTI